MGKNIVILAAGMSSRMKKSLAESNTNEVDHVNIGLLNKALIKLGKENRPFLDYLLFNIEKAGYENIYLVVGENADEFKKFYGKKERNNSYKSLNISYAVQYIPENHQKPLGTADALMQLLDQHPKLINDSFTVCNADNLYSIEALKGIRQVVNPNAFIAFDRDGLDFPLDRISKFALTVLDENLFLIDIIEKPQQSFLEEYQNKMGALYVSMNLWKLQGSEILPYLKSCPINSERNEKELPTAILNMIIKSSTKVKALHFRQHVPDLTSEADISILQKNISDFF